MAKVTHWIKRAVGEISKLRFPFSSIGSKTHAIYTLNSNRVDYGLARKLYRNTHEEYKLGAGFAKPVINTFTSFTGLPEFSHDDPEVQDILEQFKENNSSKMMKTHRNALCEGDAFIMLTREEFENAALYPEDDVRLKYTILPPEQVSEIIRDPITGTVKEYVLVSEHNWSEGTATKRAKITQRISSTKKIIKIEGDTPPDIVEGEEMNIWGFIPIIHFKNDSDELESFGRSELEAIEPYLKAYHDVMLHAIQGSKMHSTPKLKLKLKDVESFLVNNFGVEDPEKFASEGGSIDLEGNELLLLTDEEDASYVEVKSAIGDAAILLEFLFYMIVDTSEIPEFAFGVHTPSSLSSVKEQMPILIRRIERIREQFEEPWQLLARMVLAMTSKSQGTVFESYATTLSWEPIDPRDSKEVAEEINIITQAIERIFKEDLISFESAIEFLSKYIDTMLPYKTDGKDPDESTRIMKTRLAKMRLEDGQFLESQKSEIDKELEVM